jgi:hypothetical protein
VDDYSELSVVSDQAVLVEDSCAYFSLLNHHGAGRRHLRTLRQVTLERRGDRLRLPVRHQQRGCCCTGQTAQVSLKHGRLLLVRSLRNSLNSTNRALSLGRALFFCTLKTFFILPEPFAQTRRPSFNESRKAGRPLRKEGCAVDEFEAMLVAHRSAAERWVRLRGAQPPTVGGQPAGNLPSRLSPL